MQLTKKWTMVKAKNNGSVFKWLDYFFVLRPMLFFPGWSTLLAGYFISYKHLLLFEPQLLAQTDHIKIIVVLISFAMAMGSCFLLNQLVDKITDRENNKLFFLSHNMIKDKAAYIWAFFLIISALLLALKVNINFLLFSALFVLITGYFYNYSPFKLKDRPWGSLFANAAMGWLAFALGWSANNTPTWRLLSDSLPYLFFNTALYFYTTLPDIKGDKMSRKKTLAVRFGIDHLIILSFILFTGGLISVILNKDMIAGWFYILSAPLFIMTLFRRDTKTTILATKYGILFFAISILLKWPYYILLMVSGFFLTRWYFKFRFDFDYPNFSGN